MVWHWGNFFGRLSNIYWFDDESHIKRTSRESVSYTTKDGKEFNISILYDGDGHYEYIMPDNVSNAELSEMEKKMRVYFKKKHMRLK
jgi:hypothetical protein